MATTKPENVFIASVHRRLASVYFEKLCNPFRSGTPDVWYSGDRGDLWIEYKFLPKIPRSEGILPDLSAQQRRWLDSRAAEGRNVAVVIGCKEGAVIYCNRDWSTPISTSAFLARVVSRDALAAWIVNHVGVKQCSQSAIS